jgi:hypothetical protein
LEIKGDLDQDFRLSAEKVFKSGYTKDWIIVGSKSPVWNQRTSLVELQGKYVSCESVCGFQKQGWSDCLIENGDSIQVYYDYRKKLLWKVESENIAISRCSSCDKYVFCSRSRCLICHNESLSSDSSLSVIPRDWQSFSNVTQWHKGQENDREIIIEPISKQLNPFHPNNKKEFVESLRRQFSESGQALFCSGGCWDWEEMICILDNSIGLYMSASSDFCCRDNHILVVETVDFVKLTGTIKE